MMNIINTILVDTKQEHLYKLSPEGLLGGNKGFWHQLRKIVRRLVVGLGSDYRKYFLGIYKLRSGSGGIGKTFLAGFLILVWFGSCLQIANNGDTTDGSIIINRCIYCMSKRRV